MRKILLLITTCCVVALANAQNINAAEYFVDTDPGAGNGVAVTVTAGTTVSFNATIPTASLSNGFHFVGIRARDAAGKWGLYETRGFFITTAGSNAGNFNAVEYFIDTDPGAGNGVPVAVTAGASVNFSAVVPTTALANGFHFIGIRTRDLNGQWGLYETRGFYISSSTSNVGNINAAEFFVDTDPGVGNGTSVSVIPGATVTFTTTISTTALSPGFHFAAIRTRDVNGNWSLYETRGFYIITSTANVGNITAAEFFVDTDPGIGNGTVVTITPGTTVSFIANVATTSLSPGFHFVAIRTRDAIGKWGLYESRGFYISTQTTNVPNMVAAEYFIDADPGVGNGSPIGSVPNATTISQNFALLVPPGTPNGPHILALRFRGADGKWGLFDTALLTVAGALPLHFLSFDAYKAQRSVSLKWRTADEVNTSHFEIERSINGVDFVKIGQVSSRNTPGNHDYSMDDWQPAKGINLYRLKQVDLDGRFEYSKIVRVLFDMQVNMLVYPNPSSGRLNIDLNKTAGKWFSSIYDAQGRLVRQEVVAVNGTTMQLDVAALPKGNYSIVLNNGVEVLHAKFAKQ
jgi:hypothetical protein